ncbi:MAG: hypothetical protein RIB93_01505 [Coleofasciculus sp. D1-CHI-01]
MATSTEPNRLVYRTQASAIASHMLELPNRTVDGLPSYYGGD